jgi:hypothetical protein
MVPREDLPLLAASVEHKAWMQALEQHLKNNRPDPPAMEPDHCHFGAWLHGAALAHLGSSEAHRELDALHQRLHRLAQALCQEHALHPEQATEDGMAEVLAVSHELQTKLKLLLPAATPDVDGTLH